MQTTVRVILTLFVAVSAVILGWSTVNYYFFSPWTRDARVTVDVVTIAPDVSGYVAEVNYLPWLNTKLQLQYVRYSKFNGASNNYDGFGRNASDNDTLYLVGWLMF